jgi:hypothetical protein
VSLSIGLIALYELYFVRFLLESEADVAADVLASFIESLVREILFHQWAYRSMRFGSSGLLVPESWAKALADHQRHNQAFPTVPLPQEYLQVIESFSLSLRFGKPGKPEKSQLKTSVLMFCR